MFFLKDIVLEIDKMKFNNLIDLIIRIVNLHNLIASVLNFFQKTPTCNHCNKMGTLQVIQVFLQKIQHRIIQDVIYSVCDIFLQLNDKQFH